MTARMHELVQRGSVIMDRYLASSYYIDWQHPAILALAKTLARGAENSETIIKRCFEYVRDDITHSWDHQANPVTCKASDVLAHGTGFCYAKSHLLAALLRANQIPAGLCYQRLAISDDGAAFCLHGLNAVYLEEHGWYRIDPRGNKAGVTSSFCPPVEQLAFAVVMEGEADLPEIWEEPLPQVVQVLESSETYLDVDARLPDIEVIGEHQPVYSISA